MNRLQLGASLVLPKLCKVVIARPTSPEILSSLSMAKQRSITSNLGLYVYAGAAIFLGLLGLVSGDFATTWQNIGPQFPLRVPLAYLTAVIELAGGDRAPRTPHSTSRRSGPHDGLLYFYAYLGAESLCESRQFCPDRQCL